MGRHWKSRAWTSEHDATLAKCLDEGLPRDVIAERMNRSPTAITERMKTIGRTTSTTRTRWSKAEVETLRRLCLSRANASEASRALPGRSRDSIRKQVKKLGLKMESEPATKPTRKCLTQRMQEDLQ